MTAWIAQVLTSLAVIASLPADPAVITHVLDRTSFGARTGDIERVQAQGLDRYVDDQLHPERLNDAGLDARLALIAPSDKPILDLQQEKVLRAVYSSRQLQEVLVDFWFNHFNVDARKGADRMLLANYERDVIRPRVLGKFRDLLGATAKSPAMLFYLDNWRSGGKDGLNENYGRELMELHTLGVDGGYTQQDVTEVARAFTGWTIDRPRIAGDFVFRPRLHEEGRKSVLGHAIDAGGMRDGEQVLDILARHPSTARFISTKLARRFVSDTPPASLIERLATRFKQTDGDLREVMHALLTSPEFLSPDQFHQKIKTPFEFVVSAVRATDAEVHDARPLVQHIAQLGEPLYQCQPPTGYKDTADAWVNTGALVGRMNFGLALASNRFRAIVVSNSTPDGIALGAPAFQRK